MIDAALKRIENGSYGVCARCGDPIGEDRLDVLPQTPMAATAPPDAPDTRLSGRLRYQGSRKQGRHAMFNHVSVGTRDLEGASRFYDAALGALGYRRTIARTSATPGGSSGRSSGRSRRRRARRSPATACTWRSSPSREAVDRFHAAGLAAGGTDAGAPGARDYIPDYYAAFLRDPDGNKIEAVHLPQVPFPES